LRSRTWINCNKGFLYTSIGGSLYAELYAVATAFLRGFSAIPIKKGLKNSNPITNVFIYLTINTFLLWSITFAYYPLKQLFFKGFEYFVLAGFFAPGISQIFRDAGFKRLGVAITYPIVSINTLFSMIIAIIFLNEKITIYIVLGSILTFLGVFTLTWQRDSKFRLPKKDLYLPILSALFFACSVNLREIGLSKIKYPIIGAAITSTVSFMILLIHILIMKVRKKYWILQLHKDAVKFFIFSGIISCIAFLLYFIALSKSNVVVVQPIASTRPLFAALFSYFLLKEEEKITRKIILGSLLIVSGIIFLFR